MLLALNDVFLDEHPKVPENEIEVNRLYYFKLVMQMCTMKT